MIIRGFFALLRLNMKSRICNWVLYTCYNIYYLLYLSYIKSGRFSIFQRPGVFTMDALSFIFTVLILLGLAVPLLDVLLGVFGSILNVDFEIGGHHFGDMFNFSPGAEAGVDGTGDAGTLLPFNIMSLCFAMVVFGALGRLTLGLMVNTLAIIGCLIGLLAVSFGAYLALYHFIVKPLRKNNPKAIGEWDLYAAKGRLILRITKESPGTVSLKDNTGANISYRAKAKENVLELWDGLIPQGTEVVVTDVDAGRKTVYVRPLDTFDNHKLSKTKD